MINHRHFILNKPYGYLSLFVYNQTGRKKTKLLGVFYDFPDKTMAIGRLDEKSEGLLFLTTDGKVSEQVRSKSVEKEYYVQVDGYVIYPNDLLQIKNDIFYCFNPSRMSVQARY